MFTECGLSSSDSDTNRYKEFHARGPATEKALSLRRKLVRGIQKSPRELERKRVSE